MKHLTKAFVCLVMASSCSQLYALDTDIFLETYLSGKISELEPFLSEQVVFKDSAMHFSGKEIYIGTLTQVFSHIEDGVFDRTQKIQSNNDTLYTGELTFSYKGEGLGVPGKVFKFQLPFAVALTVEDGLVTRHVDYVDSIAFAKQFEAQTDTAD